MTHHRLGEEVSSARATSDHVRECERMGLPLTTHAAQPFIEQMPAAIAIFDGGMRYRAVSRRYLSDLAWLFSTEVLPPDKVIGRTIYEVSPDAPPRWRDVHARVLAGEELSQEEDFVLRKDGRAPGVTWSLTPLRNVHGRIRRAP